MELRPLSILFCVLVVVAPSGGQADYLTDGLAIAAAAIASVVDGYYPWGLGQVERFWEAQLFPAAMDAVVPTQPNLRNKNITGFSQIRRCPRADVHKCLYYGMRKSVYQ